MWILLSREKVWATWCEVFMELLRAYLKQTKIFLIAFVFAVAASAAVVCLYQLPAEAVIYMAVLWLGAGAAAFLGLGADVFLALVAAGVVVSCVDAEEGFCKSIESVI